MQASDCDAKASFNSTISISSILRFALLSAFWDAPIGPSPITSGSHPWTEVETIRAKISKLLSFANCSSQIKVVAAPSVNGDDVAAVTVPFWSNASFKPSSFSWLELGLIFPSVEQLLMVVISFLKYPFDWAWWAFWWLDIAKSCCSFLDILYFFATFSAVIPIEK